MEVEMNKDAQMIESLLEAASRKVVDFVEQNGVVFKRGDVHKYFLRISKVNLGLSLPQLPKEVTLEALVLKNFYALWNILVDDEIDGEGKSTLLEDSISLVVTGIGSSSAAKLLELILAVARDTDAAESMRFDILNICQGFAYEKFINGHEHVATIPEYQHYSTLTASLNIIYNIDLSYLNSSDISHINHIRALYFHLGKAVKYSSDIGSLEREINTEKNLNLTLLKFAELKGIGKKEQIFSEAQAIPEELQQAIKYVKDLAQAELNEAEAALTKLDNSYSMIYQAASSMVKGYWVGADIFFGIN